MSSPDPCGLCWGPLPPAEEWSGGICETCQDDFTEEHHQLQEESR